MSDNEKKSGDFIEKIKELLPFDANKANMYKILCIVLMVVLIITLGAWGLAMYSKNQAYEAYEGLAEKVNKVPKDTEDEDEEESEQVDEGTETESMEVVSTETESTEETETQEPEVLTDKELLKQLGLKVPKKNLDWDELHKINEDIYAWIYIPNTEVEYPVLQHPTDDEYYLNRNMNGSFGKPGCVFTQSLNNKDFLDMNTIIYGHNMKSGMMFQTLHKYEEEKFFEENPYIYVYTEDRELVYQVFAAYMSDDSHILNSNDFSTVEGYSEYLEKVYVNSKLGNRNDNVTVNAMNRILTLSTCGKYTRERFLVQAVLLNDPVLYGIEE